MLAKFIDAYMRLSALINKHIKLSNDNAGWNDNSFGYVSWWHICQKNTEKNLMGMHDDVIKWKYFPRYWPFVRSFDVFFDLRPNKRLS